MAIGNLVLGGLVVGVVAIVLAPSLSKGWITGFPFGRNKGR